MALSFDPSGFLCSGRQDETVRSGEWLIGRIWEDPKAGEDSRWRWSLYVPITGPRAISRIGRAATFDKAKEQLTDSWSKLLAWSGLQQLR
jgi:hypothetical protein